MIKKLSDDTIQKIAAGEVVERPSSIVKELVENSIDAKSSNITVEIKNGGKSYIKVVDDGMGIEKQDIELAFTRHATSKIEDFEDLYKIVSMGFRGEALASIISVAQVIMKTRADKDEIGSRIVYDNNKLISDTSLAMNRGTSIEVLDLFKYVPARLKFLSSDITESNRISHLMHVLAIGHPEISFTYIKDNREIFRTNKINPIETNYDDLFGKDFTKNSIVINHVSNNYKIDARISNNKVYKGNRSMQFIFVNGRYIESNDIQEAVESAYSNLIPSGRYPMYDLKIEVDPSLIDINIHPNKQKIKFSFAEELLKVIKETFTLELYKADQEKEVVDQDKSDNNHISFYDLKKGDGYKKVLDAYKEPIDVKEFLNYDDKPLEKDQDKSFETVIEVDEEDVYEYNFIEEEVVVQEEIVYNQMEEYEFITSVFNKYALYKDDKEGLVVLDIVRCNERIIFDNFNKDSNLVSQDLIEPIIHTLNNLEVEMLESTFESFTELGFDISYLDSNTIAIRKVPYFMEDPSSLTNFTSLLDKFDKQDDKDYLDILLKRAISLASKKSKNLNMGQGQMLIRDLFKTSNPYTSPHGKTILYKLDSEQFSKFLER